MGEALLLLLQLLLLREQARRADGAATVTAEAKKLTHFTDMPDVRDDRGRGCGEGDERIKRDEEAPAQSFSCGCTAL